MMKGWRFVTGLLTWTVSISLVAPLALASRGREQPLAVVQDRKYGYIDHTGRIIIKPQFIWADDFWHGLGTVFACGHLVSIDASGTVLRLRAAVPGLPELESEGRKVGFVDESGRFKIPPSFDDALPFSGGRAAVQTGGKWGFIDTSGKWVIPARFTAAFYFREGVATVAQGSEFSLINLKGEVIASGYGFTSGIVMAGRVPVSKDKKDGYLDLEGRIAIPLVYDEVTTFSGGLAAVRKEDKWGYIDPTGRVAIPFELDEAGPFASGLAPVKMGSRTAFINKAGKVAFELPFESAPGFLVREENSRLVVADSDVSRFFTADGKFGYVNTSGKVIWGPTDGNPFHAPLLGWSEKDKIESCQGISETIKNAIARLFPR
jgi:hypothetical protein